MTVGRETKGHEEAGWKGKLGLTKAQGKALEHRRKCSWKLKFDGAKKWFKAQSSTSQYGPTDDKETQKTKTKKRTTKLEKKSQNSLTV